MEATRRQSGRLAAAALIQSARTRKDNTGELESDDSEMADLTSEDEAQSDFDAPRPVKRARRTSVAAKRTPAKASPKSKAPTRAKAPARKRKKDLSNIMEMPMDILFEILGWLKPDDLFSLSKVSADFCRILTARNTSAVWKTARVRTGAPCALPGWSETRWMKLLFGSRRCQVCKTGRSPLHVEINFALGRRVCESCKNFRLVPAPDYWKKYRNLDSEIPDLIVFTTDEEANYWNSEMIEYFWRDDIMDMSRSLGFFDTDAALQTFKEQRIKFVAETLKHAEICSEWQENFIQQKEDEIESRKQARLKEVIARLVTLGYHEQDTASLNHFPSAAFEKDEPITDEVWSRVGTRIEFEVTIQRDARLARERAPLLRKRQEVVTKVYKAWSETCSPDTWRCLLLAPDIHHVPDFHALITSPGDAAIDEGACTLAMSKLPHILPKLLSDVKEALRTALEAAIPSPLLNVNSPNLATAVFVAGTETWPRRVVFGMPEWVHSRAGRHKGILDDVSSVEVSKLHADSVVGILGKLGMDPLSTTPSQLDARDARFICKGCPAIDLYQSRKVMTWRDAVNHSVHNYGSYIVSAIWSCSSDHAVSKLRLLTEKEAGEVSERPFDESWFEPVWTCNHCPVLGPMTHEQILSHLKSAHALMHPVNDVDYFWLTRVKPYPSLANPREYPPKPTGKMLAVWFWDAAVLP